MTPKTCNFADCRESRDVGPADGIYFVGRPAWLTRELLASLQEEAACQRVSAEHIRAQYFGDTGPVAEALIASPGLREFVTENSVPVRASGRANYRYYDIPESQVRPHVDNDNFALNLIIMLAHAYGAQRRSGLLLFPRGPDDPVAIGLEPGEVILFNARDVIHARTPISEDGCERAVNLGIGFTPESPLVGYRYWHPETGWHDGL
jgi:hypothetical protein